MALFDRVAELIVGQSGGKGVSIKAANGTGLRFSFAIEKTASSTPNSSVVRIWNMRDETRRIVETPNNVVILKAGYAQDTGAQTIFVGVVTRSTTMREGSDWVTEIELADGLIAYRDGKASLQFPPGSNALAVVSGIAAKFSLPVKTLPTGITKTYPQGFSFVGKLRDAMNKACDYADLEWSIVNQEIQIIKKGSVFGQKNIKKKTNNNLQEIKDAWNKELDRSAAVGAEADKFIERAKQAEAGGNEDMRISFLKQAQEKNNEAKAIRIAANEKYSAAYDAAEKQNKENNGTGLKAIVLSSDTGMIGSPQPEAKTMSEKSAAKQGIKVDESGRSAVKKKSSKSLEEIKAEWNKELDRSAAVGAESDKFIERAKQAEAGGNDDMRISFLKQAQEKNNEAKAIRIAANEKYSPLYDAAKEDLKNANVAVVRKTKDKLEVRGYTVDSLLQPSINPGSYVQVKSFDIDGEFFRVESVTHRGDTGGGEWKTSMTLRFI